MDESGDPGEFFQQFLRMIGKGQHDVLTLSGRPQWRMTYHIITSAWKMPISWHSTGHSGGYWQQAELRTEMV